MAQPSPNDSPSLATLQSLPGFVFHCNKDTLPDCLKYSTFGSCVEFKGLKINSPLWLLNYSDKSILGLYYAKSLHTYLDNQLWGGKYKWQVQVDNLFNGKMPQKAVMKLIGRQGKFKLTILTSDESGKLVREFIDRLCKPQKLQCKSASICTPVTAKIHNKSRLLSYPGAPPCFELLIFGVCSKLSKCSYRHEGSSANGDNLQTEFEKLRVRHCKDYNGSTCKRTACPFIHKLDAKETTGMIEHPYIVVLREKCVTGSIIKLKDRILKQKFKYFYSTSQDVLIFLRDLFCQYIFMTMGKIGTAVQNDFVLVCGDAMPSEEILQLIREGKGELESKLQTKDGYGEAQQLSEMVALEIQKCSRYIRKNIDSLANKKSINDRRMNMRVDAPDNSKSKVSSESKVSIYFNTRKHKVELSKSHFDFLVEAYEYSPDLKLIRIWNCVFSYHHFGDLRNGYHASISPPVVSVLQSEYGTTHECFASPLNRTMKNYNSLLFDYDKWFGSDGSFFKDNKEEGCFECNPPFDVHTVKSVILEIRDRLERSNAPLSYVIILPFSSDIKKIFDDENKDLRGIKKFVRWNAKVPKGAKFAHGSQSDMSERKRKGIFSKGISWNFNSKVMFVVCQNEGGTAKWPVDEEKFEKVKAAFTKKFDLDDLATSKLSHKLLKPLDNLNLDVNDDDDLFTDTEEDTRRAVLELKICLGIVVDKEGILTKIANPTKPTTKPFLSESSEEDPEEDDQDAFDRAKNLLFPDCAITPSDRKMIEDYLLVRERRRKSRKRR